MATKTITSDQNESKVGPNGTPIFTSTRITYTLDENGKVDPNATKFEILYKSAHFGSPTVGAVRTGTDKDWTFPLKAGFGDPVLGADAQKSLKEGALKTTTNQQIDAATTKEGFTPEQKRAVSLTPNQATTNPSGGESGRAPTDKENADINKDIKSGKSRNSFPGKTGEPLKYPLTLKNEHQDVIKFKMVRYRPRTISNQTGNLLNPVGGRKETLDIIGVVVLPVPSGISDMNAVSWNGGDLNPFEAMGIDIAQSGIIKGIGSAVDSASNAVQNAQNNAGEVQTAATNAFVQAAMGVSNLLSRTQGAIINPNLELLFQAPTLRPFDFTFKLSARKDKESQAILKIIRFFKQGMSPIRSEANLFLKAPHTFQLEYLHKGGRHIFLNRFKECALTSFSVDYTPEGQYATFTDGAMVSYQIRMQFQELEPIFNDDYSNPDLGGDNDKDIQIGF